MEKNTIFDQKFVPENSCKFFTLRGDVLKMVINYKFNTTYSPEAKLNIDFMDEMRFNIHARCNIPRDRTLIKNYFNKRRYISMHLG